MTSKPEVSKSISYDDRGRPVVSYRICDTSPVLGSESCRTETVVHNYCYRSLGRVDCYENEQPGRTRCGPTASSSGARPGAVQRSNLLMANY